MENPASYWSPLLALVPRLRCWVRISWGESTSLEEGQWGQMLIMPTPTYLEASDGPIPLRDVKWVEVSTVRLKGGLAGHPLEMIDMKDEVITALLETKLDWEISDGIWSIEGIFEAKPVQLLRIGNPFRPEQ